MCLQCLPGHFLPVEAEHHAYLSACSEYPKVFRNNPEPHNYRHGSLKCLQEPEAGEYHPLYCRNSK